MDDCFLYCVFWTTCKGCWCRCHSNRCCRNIYRYYIFVFSALRIQARYTHRYHFLIIALLGIIPWVITKDPTISVVIAVSIDFIGFMPTLRKTWQHPETETPLLYSMNVVRHILMLFSLQAYNIATTLHSIVMIVTNSIMTAFIMIPRNLSENK